ncbi:MAG: hypothetical protein M3Y05_02745, partial [Gemmatimonadota bacterium]|nr:hypothetical protein [Gemmatimonadota bacterium]
QAGDAEMVRSLSMLSKIYMASGKTQLGGEIADKAAQRQKRVGQLPRSRTMRARLDRDTPDFSAEEATPPKVRAAQPAPSLAPPIPVATRAPSHTPGARASTPDHSGTAPKPSTPAAPGLIKAYAQMIESAEDARRGKRRPWWSRILGR